MPETRPEDRLQEIYKSLKQDGTLKEQPRLSELIASLVKDGVLKDESGGTNYAKPTPTPPGVASTPSTGGSVSGFGPDEDSWLSGKPTTPLRVPKVTFRDPANGQPAKTGGDSLFSRLTQKPAPSSAYDAATEKAIAQTKQAVKSQPKANPTYQQKPSTSSGKRYSDGAMPATAPPRNALERGAARVGEALAHVGQDLGNTAPVQALEDSGMMNLPRLATAPLVDPFIATGAAAGIAQARAQGDHAGAAKIMRDFLATQGTDGAGAFTRSAESSTLPSMGGLAGAGAGMRMMAPLAMKAGPLGGFLLEGAAGAGGALLGAAGVQKLQDSAMSNILGPDAYAEFTKQQSIDAAFNPTATRLGGLAPLVATSGMNLLSQGIRQTPQALRDIASQGRAGFTGEAARAVGSDVGQRLAGAAIPTAINTVTDWAQGGKVDPMKALQDMALFTVLGKPNKAGAAVSGAGQKAADTVSSVFSQAKTGADLYRSVRVAQANGFTSDANGFGRAGEARAASEGVPLETQYKDYVQAFHPDKHQSLAPESQAKLTELFRTAVNVGKSPYSIPEGLTPAQAEMVKARQKPILDQYWQALRQKAEAVVAGDPVSVRATNTARAKANQPPAAIEGVGTLPRSTTPTVQPAEASGTLKPTQIEKPTATQKEAPTAPVSSTVPIHPEAPKVEAVVNDSAQKEPWQMTQEELDHEYPVSPATAPPARESGKRGIEQVRRSVYADSVVKAATEKHGDKGSHARGDLWTDATFSHRDAVKRALAEGRPVPAEVLADYPDLAARQAPKPATATAPDSALPANLAPPPKPRVRTAAPKVEAPTSSEIPRALQTETGHTYLGKNASGGDVFLDPDGRRIIPMHGTFSYEGLKYRGATESERQPVYQIAKSTEAGASPADDSVRAIEGAGGTIERPANGPEPPDSLITAPAANDSVKSQGDPDQFRKYVESLTKKGMDGIAAGQPKKASAYFPDGYEYEISAEGSNGTWRASRTSNRESGADTPALKPSQVKAFPSAESALRWLIENRKKEYYQSHLDREKSRPAARVEAEIRKDPAAGKAMDEGRIVVASVAKAEQGAASSPVATEEDGYFTPEALKSKSGGDLSKMREKLTQLQKLMPDSDVLAEQIGRITQEQARRGTEPSADDPSEEWHVAKSGDIYKATKERGIYSLVKMGNTASGKSATPQILSTQTKSIAPMRENIQGLAGGETDVFPDRAGAMARRAEIRSGATAAPATTPATKEDAGTLKTQGKENGSETTGRREADSRADSQVAGDGASDPATPAPRGRVPGDVPGVHPEGRSEGVSAQSGAENHSTATPTSGGGADTRRGRGDSGAADVSTGADPLARVESHAPPAEVAPNLAQDVDTGGLSGSDEPSRPNFFRGAADVAEAMADGRKMLSLVKSIEALKAIEQQGRSATIDEQRVLADFPGWGWTGNLLSAKNAPKGNYARTPVERAYEKLTGLLDKEEFRAALQATQYSHFTAPEVIASMWDALRRMGYTGGGSVLEPSMGNGLFFQLMPEDMRGRTRLTGVEKDSLTGRIAAQLFQGSKIYAGKGFEEVQKAIGDNSQDIILSNVPFGNLQIFDPEGEKKWGNTLLTRRIHNWFFAKSLDKAKPGGIIAFITSSGTLDANDAVAQETRAHLARGADFLGAIRLPNTAFQKNAGTEVTTDIIFLRKKGEGVPEVPATPFQSTVDAEGKDGQVVRVNEYFAAHPEMVLGIHSMEGKMRHGGGNEYALLSDGRDIAQAIAQAVESLPAGVFAPQRVEGSAVKSSSKQGKTSLRRGALTVQDGKLYGSTPVGDEAILEEVEPLSADTLPIIQKYSGIRDTLRELITAQLSPDSTTRQKNDLRKILKSQYDAFVKAHGPLHKGAGGGKPAIADHFVTDPNAYDVLSLEKWDRKGRKVTGLSDIFTKDVIAPNKTADSAVEPGDALGIVLRQSGRVDMEQMIALLAQGGVPMTEGQLYEILNGQGVLFKTPGGSFETAEEYGSGNVREKLALAQMAAIGDEAYQSNVKFLESVQPAHKGAADISVGLGASWVPVSIVNDFLSHIGVNGTVNYSSAVGKFEVKAGGWTDPIKATATFGTTSVNAAVLLDHALTGSLPTVYDNHRDGTRTLNAEATEAARDKLGEIREEWTRWIYEDATRANELVTIYNDKVNVFQSRKYDGSALTFPGQNPLAFPNGLRGHQKNAVWRIIQDRFVLLAHEVGTGKTATMITAAMELRRMGLRQKPLIVVKKPTIGQFAESFKRMYPAARILVADSRNFSADNRKEFMAQIATGDWDAVIVWHNAFELLSVSPETASEFYNEQIEQLEAFVAEQQRIDAKSFTAKQAGKKIENMKSKLARLQLQIGERQDDSTYWDDLGVDQIFVDESQTYKKLAVDSEIEGMGHEGNQITFDMLMKIRSLQKNGGGAVFASGTPLTNSISEVHSLSKYLRPDLLRDQGQYNFDDWARTYGTLAPSFEQDVAGRYQNKQRFNKFSNVQELMALYRSFADTVFAEDIAGLVRPRLTDRSGKVTDKPIVVETVPDEQQKKFFQQMLARADSLPTMREAMAIKEAGGIPDGMLKISTEGRQVSLDPRLVIRGAKDNPKSKINKVVEEVLAIHLKKKHADNRRTQLVFLDQGVPGDKGQWSLYQDITEKLVAGGAARSSIAWISDAKTDEAREKMFEKVSDGEIRILIGSREKMGVGVNVQERLIAIHQVDPTWRPDQIEQATGRILRQGNLFPEEGVHEFHYINKGSFDGFMWKKVQAKLGFINQLLRGDATTNEVEDLSGDDAFSLEQMFAVATGDSRIERYMQLGEEVRRLTKATRYHLGVRADLLRRASTMERDLPSFNKTVEKLRDVVKWRDLNPSPTESDNSQATMSRWASLDPTNYEKMIHSSAVERWEKRKEKFYAVKKNAGEPFEEAPAPPRVFTKDGNEYRFTPEEYGLALWRVAMAADGKVDGGTWRGAGIKVESDKKFNAITFTISPPGAPHTLTVPAKLSLGSAPSYPRVLDNRLQSVDQDIQGYLARIAGHEDQIPKAKEQAEKPFAKTGELAQNTKELEALTEELGPLLKRGSARGWGGVVKEVPKTDDEEGVPTDTESVDSPALPLPARPAPEEPSPLHLPSTTNFDGGELGAPIAPASSRIPVAAIPWDRKPLKDTGTLINALADAVGRAVLVGKTKRGTAGTYRPSDARIKIRFYGDMETSVHEIGHALDDDFNLVGGFSAPRQRSPWDVELFQGELQTTAKTGMTLKLRRAEAVAEFMRLLAVNPVEAERIAPTFAAHVKATLPPRVLTALEDFGMGARRIAGAPAHIAAQTHIQWGEGDQRSIRQKLIEAIKQDGGPDFSITVGDKITTQLQDSLRPVVVATEWARKLTGAGNVLPKNDPILLMRAHDYTVQKVGEMLESGFTDINQNPVIDPTTGEAIGGLKWLFAPVLKPSVAKTESMMRLAAVQGLAERTLDDETIETGIGMGFWDGPSTARAILAEIAAMPQDVKDDLDEQLRRYRIVSNWGLDYLVDSGRLSKEDAQAIKDADANQHYISLQRVQDDLPLFEGTGRNRALAKVGTPVKKRKGSHRQIRDPFVSLLDQVYKIVVEGDRNRAIDSFIDLFRTERGLYQGAVVPLSQVMSLGTEAIEGKTIKTFHNGEAEHWEVNVPAVYKSLKAIGDPGAPKGLLKVISILSSTIPRALITGNPAFAIRNFSRDMPERWLKSEFNSLPWDSFKRFSEEEKRRYALSGGGGSHYGGSRESYARAIKAVVRDAAKSQGKHIIRLPSDSLSHSYEKLLEASELQGRLAEYRAAYSYATDKLGYDEHNAALYATGKTRELLPFLTSGNAMRVISPYIPFINANVQGFVANYKAARRNPRQFALKFLLLAAAKALPYALIGLMGKLGKDKLEEYRALPAYQRDLCINLPMPWPDGWLSIPVGFEAASASTAIERAIDYSSGNKDAWLGYFTQADAPDDQNYLMKVLNGSLAQSMLPVKFDSLMSLGGIPGALGEIRNNYDTFRQKTIVPQYEAKLPLERRKGASSASRAGIMLGRILRSDPRTVDHFIHGVGGGSGTILTSLSDIGRKDKPISPTRVAGMATGLFKEGPSYGSPQVQRALSVLDRAQAQPPTILQRAQDALRAAKTPAEMEAAKRQLRIAASSPLVPARAHIADAKRDLVDERIQGINAARERHGLAPMSPDMEKSVRRKITGPMTSALSVLRADTKGVVTERVAAQQAAIAKELKEKRLAMPDGLRKMGGGR